MSDYFTDRIDNASKQIHNLFLNKYAEDVKREEIFEILYKSLGVLDAYPVALKTHGAWDGLDNVDTLPNNTVLYAFKA